MQPDQLAPAIIHYLMNRTRKYQRGLGASKGILKRTHLVAHPNPQTTQWAESAVHTGRISLSELRGKIQFWERVLKGGITLRTTEERDLRQIWSWVNEPILRATTQAESIALQTYIGNWHHWLADTDTYPYSIDLKTGELLGFMLIKRISGRFAWSSVFRSARGSSSHPQDSPHPKNGSRYAWLEFIIIQQDSRYQGYGTEAVKLATARAFEQLGVDAFLLQVHLDNEPAFQCFENSGLRYIDVESFPGVESELDDNLYDMGILREDWERANSPSTELTQAYISASSIR